MDSEDEELSEREQGAEEDEGEGLVEAADLRLTKVKDIFCGFGSGLWILSDPLHYPGLFGFVRILCILWILWIYVASH